MAITTHTCVVVTCDVCEDPFAPDAFGSGATVHFTSYAEIRSTLPGHGWIIRPGLRGAICPEQDAAHRKAVSELMPPAPVVGEVTE